MHDPVWVSHPHKSLKVPTTEMTEKRLNSSPGISARGERGIPEIQCPSVTMTVRWEKVRSWKTSSNVSASASSLHLLRFSLARPVISAIGVVKRLFRARAGPGPSPSSAWHCSRTDSDPWWPASWLSGWWRGPAAASAPPRQPASVAPEKKKKKTQDEKVRGQLFVETKGHSRHASCQQHILKPGHFCPSWKHLHLCDQTFGKNRH